MKRVLTLLFFLLSASLVSAADYTFTQVRNFQNALTGTDQWYWLPTIIIQNTSASSENFVLSWGVNPSYYQTKSGTLTGANWSINGSSARSVTVAAGATYTVPYNGTFYMQHQVSLNSGTGGISGGAWRMSPLGSVVTGIETESIGLYRNSVNSTNLCDAVTAQVDVY